MSDSLERLRNSSFTPSNEYTEEEQIDSSEECQQEMLDLCGMSQQARASLTNKVTEVTFSEDEDDEPVIESKSEDELKEVLFNNNNDTQPQQKASRGRPPKSTSQRASAQAGEYDGILDMLATDIIDDLIFRNYAVGRFDVSMTKKILEYMRTKF